MLRSKFAEGQPRCNIRTVFLVSLVADDDSDSCIGQLTQTARRHMPPPIRVRSPARLEASKLREAELYKERTAARPWYRRGGMHVTEKGAFLTFLVPSLVLAVELFTNRPRLFQAWCTWLVACLTMGRTPGRPFLAFVNIIFPLYVWVVPLGLICPAPLVAIMGMYVAAIVKVGVCMSVCFHRFAAHQAFKCNAATSFLVCALGCLANQGGPLWWGSNHRCHHAHCEKERDPHSAKVDGDTTAFSFFDNPEHKWVDEDFVPRHIDRLSIR